VRLTQIPTGFSDIVARRIYRTSADGSTFGLLATLNDNTTRTFTDVFGDNFDLLVYDGARAVAPEPVTTATAEGTDGKQANGIYKYRITFLDSTGVESNASAPVAVDVAATNHVKLEKIPIGPKGTVAR